MFGVISFQPQAAGKVGTHRGASDPTSGQTAFKRKETGAVGLMQAPPGPRQVFTAEALRGPGPSWTPLSGVLGALLTSRGLRV